MKAISLLQPWASLVVMGAKKIETRSWNTKYRGELLIHASRNMTVGQKRLGQEFNRDFNAGLGFIEDLPTGAIIGRVILLDTFRTEGLHEIITLTANYWHIRNEIDFDNAYDKEHAFGDYSPGRYGWLLSNPVQFKQPVPAKGALSIWEYEGSIL